MATPKQHIEHIRKTTFSIGGEKNPLAPMLDQAVKYLSAELYAKDVHFLMELIQNAEDNEYLEGVDPSLEFVITSRDITNTGAPATLLIFNNEKGFSAKNIESICNVGNSTKKGNRKRGYIGEKGIGFKSVFLIAAQPCIFSNGYQIRFNEKPCPHCNLGYIVPEWVDDSPSLSDIKQIYGSASTLPTTTLILPLKPDKVNPVKQQLNSIHPEILLFLSKIKRLSVREENEDPRLNTVSAVAITRETNFLQRKNIDAESYTLHLSADENSDEFEKECSYYLWKQKFPVRQENKVDMRMEVEDWVITLAFPNGERLHRGMEHSPGIYAFLPTEMVTNFPFIIQADFILASSRETIRWDNIWNQGILDCVPFAFIEAFVSLVKTVHGAPASSLPRMFKFLPVHSSPLEKLNSVRESIKAKLAEKDIIPSESYTAQQFFHKPREVGRLMPAFWSILKKTREQGVSLHKLSSHGCYVLNSSFDEPEYDHILDFLGVRPVSSEWYVKCIQGSNIVMGVSEETYLELLHFLAVNWQSEFHRTGMGNIPLIKYVSTDGSVSLCSVNESAQRNGKTLCLSRQSCHVSWLIDWNREFRCMANLFFMPRTTQEALCSSSNKEMVLNWLVDLVNIGALSVYDYAVRYGDQVSCDRKLVIAYAHFLHHSVLNDYLSEREVVSLCGKMPLVDSYGRVIKARNAVLVPANESKWVQLIGSNPWSGESYVELGEDYLQPACFAGTSTVGKQLMNFLKIYVKASDIPHISPPNAGIPTASTPLTKQNAFLLLDWIRELKRRGIFQIPARFLACIQEGSWLKITMNGSPGYKPPSQSFLLASSNTSSKWGNILQSASVLVDIPLIDQAFYGPKITEYREELRTVGVMFEYGEACKFIGNHLMSLAASSALTKSNVISILNFIKFLRQNFLSPDEFIGRIKEERWLRTCWGDRSPVGSVLYDQEWTTARQISDIPFIDEDYYGEDILFFKPELQLLGVVVGFSGSYQLVVDCFKSPSCLSTLTKEAFLLVLDCMHHSRSAHKLVNAVKSTKCLKTNLGYKCPGECFLFHPEWGCLLKVFGGFPLVDSNFYGSSIISHNTELKELGVKVDFEDAVRVFVQTFMKQASLSSITKENVFSFISCYRKLKGTPNKFPSDLKKCIREVKWLRTRLGDYRSPRDCILFGPEWELIYPMTRLPFIDDSDKYYGNGIHEYRKELKSMGVVVEFKAGVKFAAAALSFPQNPRDIAPGNVLSLLECIRALLQEKDYSFPDAFLKQTSRGWLKTHAGFRSPGNCCLFNSRWSSHVRPTDGPFIDEDFYGSDIKLHSKELRAIGVHEEKVCSLLASHLDSHSEFDTIVRVYDFLRENKWKPDSDATRKIWIPDGLENGMWVDPEECALHDKNGLFGLQLNVLENHYKPKLLHFFSSSFNVKSNPSFDDYCKLWMVWESLGRPLTHAECCAFWECAIMQRSSGAEKTLADDLVKLPVVLGSGEILLFSKSDVFIADDLLLKDLFENSSRPIFVWCPKSNLPSLPRTRLLEVYRKIGVRTISKSVLMEELSLADGVELSQMDSRDAGIGKELIRLILGFLAVPSLDMEATKRHGAVQCLLNLKVLETMEPITVSYSLLLSDGESLKVKASSMIRWDKECSKFFTQKMDKAGGQKNLIEYATSFSEVIARGVLWDKEDQIKALSELIKVAFLLNFDEQAVQFLMKSNNLQTFLEDEELLDAAFPSV